MTVEEIRLSHQMSQSAMAEFIGISKRAYTYKIKGETLWTVVELAKIAELENDIEIPCGDSPFTFRIEPISHNVGYYEKK